MYNRTQDVAGKPMVRRTQEPQIWFQRHTDVVTQVP